MKILLLQFRGLMYVFIDDKLIKDLLGVILRRWQVLTFISTHFNAKYYGHCSNDRKKHPTKY